MRVTRKMKASSSKVLVSQIGARHRYLIPQIFYENDLLAGLYTDSISRRWVRICARVFPNKLISRWSKREVAIIPSSFIKYSLVLIFKSFLISTHLDRARLKLFGLEGTLLRWGTKGNILYAMFIENIAFTRYCKTKGLKIVVDIYEDVRTYQDCLNEVDKFKQLGVSHKYKNIYTDLLMLRQDKIEEVLDLADIVLVPSTYVFEGINEMYPSMISKVKKIPYGSSINSSKETKRSATKGSILWVGIDPFRKGLTYLNLAVEKLRLEGYDLSIRVAGITDNEIIHDNFFSNITFLGRISKEEMIKEYLSCEMFVFPTISEGYAGVILEACSLGTPVITSTNSGIDADFPGIILNNPRDIDEIAKSILKVHGNKEFQEQLSIMVSDYSQRFSRQVYAKRLTEAIKAIA